MNLIRIVYYFVKDQKQGIAWQKCDYILKVETCNVLTKMYVFF